VKIEIIGLKIEEEIKPGTDLVEILLKAAEKRRIEISNGDVIAITSKIVSKAEGRLYKLSDVKPSKKALILSKIYGKDPREIELILRNSDGIAFIIPIKKLMKKYGYLFSEYAVNPKVAMRLIDNDPYIFMTYVEGMILTDAGLDFSNSPEGYCTLPPADPDLSADRIRRRIKELTGKEVGVVIADTEWKIDRFGSVDIAIGSSGIEIITKKFGSTDLYGKPKFGGVDIIPDLVAASANLLFGQTDEAIPIVIIKGIKFKKSEKIIKDIVYGRNIRIMKAVIIQIILENLAFRIINGLIKILRLSR